MLKHLVIGILVVAGFYFWTNKEVTHGPGEIAPDTPQITRLTWEKPFTFKQYQITPKRMFQGEVRVLEKKRYFFDDRADLVPFDVFIGWSKLSDERNLTNFNVSIKNRDASLGFTNPPIPINEIYNQTDLVHFVASNKEVRQALSKLKKGDIVRFKGFLSDISTERGLKWESSISLKDLGHKADKIVWLEEFIIL